MKTVEMREAAVLMMMMELIEVLMMFVEVLMMMMIEELMMSVEKHATQRDGREDLDNPT